MGNIVKLNSFICEKIWGGKKLAPIKSLQGDLKIGETWEVSSQASGSVTIGSLPLSQVCSLSYIVKFIDTADNLSIQVHPPQDYAQEYENSSGKAECWLILDAEKGAGVYLGFKKGVTKKEFFMAVENHMPVDKYLNFLPVKRGEFFYLPPGAIHAIGAGITLCEVQQSSEVTYRVWDWNRLGLNGEPRELHIEKAQDVANFNEAFNEKLLSSKKESLFSLTGTSKLVTHKDFITQFFSYSLSKKIELTLDEKDSIIILAGTIAGDIELSTMESAIVLEADSFTFQTSQNTAFLLVSSKVFEP